jgi:hypothetical protein
MGNRYPLMRIAFAAFVCLIAAKNIVCSIQPNNNMKVGLIRGKEHNMRSDGAYSKKGSIRCQIKTDTIEYIWKNRGMLTGYVGDIISREKLEDSIKTVGGGEQEWFLDGLLGLRTIKEDGHNDWIKNRWKETLLSKLGKVTRVLAIWEDRGQLNVADIVGEENARRLLEAVEVDEQKEFAGWCKCAADGIWKMEYQGGKDDYLTMHHWQHMNWSGWPDDGMLTVKSIEKIKGLLYESRCKNYRYTVNEGQEIEDHGR